MKFQFKYGIVSDVKNGFVRVYFADDEEGFVSPWLPQLVRKSLTDKESWTLEINEHVVCLLDPFCNEGICLGAIPNSKDKPDPEGGPGKYRKVFEDGTSIEYDKTNHVLQIDAVGKVIVNSETQVHIQGSKVFITGDLDVEGKISVTGEANIQGKISTQEDVTAGIVSLKNHLHGGVQSGGALTLKPQ